MSTSGETGSQDGGGVEQEAPTASTSNYGSSSFECPELAAFGLPTSFGRRRGDDGEPPDDKPRRILKRAHEIDAADGDTVKSAFELMGYAFEGADGAQTKGEVVYKKKHIRLHNRMLKMKNQRAVVARQHIYFDDEGNETPAVAEEPEAALIHTSSDDDSGAAPPQRVPIAAAASAVFGSSENPSSLDQDEGAIEVAETQTKREKKKKRKPKLATILPPEIVNDKSLLKYWYKRFSLFSNFDQGIKLDKGGLKEQLFKLLESFFF